MLADLMAGRQHIFQSIRIWRGSSWGGVTFVLENKDLTL